MFKYVIGEHITDTPWQRPQKGRITDWWEEFKVLQGVENYSFYIGGAVANNVRTWDVDIIMIKEKDNNNYEEIKFLLNEAMRIGFKHKQLLDIFCDESLMTEAPRDNNFKIRTWIGSEKHYNGEVKINKTKTDDTELIPGLWKCVAHKPLTWTHEKIKDGTYKTICMPIEEYLY